jgi:hypothetical protein
VVSVLSVPAEATYLLPNGYPTGESSVCSPWYGQTRYRVYLSPPNVDLVNADPGAGYLTAALAAQGISTANGWTISHTALNSRTNFYLGTYLAWAETGPSVTQGSVTVASEVMNGYGGAALGVRCAPWTGDPSGTSVHWIQLIAKNDPGPNKGAYYVQATGTSWYIDNDPNPAGDQF